MHALPKQTRDTLFPNGQHSGKGLSRSLLSSRYLTVAGSENDKEWRSRNCDAITEGDTWLGKIDCWRALLRNVHGLQVLYGRAAERMILNASGSVMENGGLCLDRNSGLPYIPASAVKGCARRSALLELQAASTASPKAVILTRIALAFGWTESDWRSGRKQREDEAPGDFHSDFAWACGEQWDAVREEVWLELLSRLRPKAEFGKEPWKQIPCFAGGVNFLDGFLVNGSPPVTKVLITPHHQKYYASKSAAAVATDDDNPIPVLFPAIGQARDTLYAFGLIFARRSGLDLRPQVAAWLKYGLENLGIGSRTTHGFGVFALDDAARASGESLLPTVPIVTPVSKLGIPLRDRQPFTLTFLTPCFAAGRKPIEAEIRGEAIVGRWRWWFRALGGNKIQETEVFGGITPKCLRSRVRVRVSGLSRLTRSSQIWSPDFVADGNEKKGDYLHYWLTAPNQGQSRMWETPPTDRPPTSGKARVQSQIAPGSSFRLEVTGLDLLQGGVHELAELSLRALLAYGGIGFRLTRGFGAWVCAEKPEDSCWESELQKELEKRGFAFRKIKSIAKMTAKENPHAQLHSAMNFVEQALKRWRNKDDGWPAKKPSVLGSPDPRQASAIYFRLLPVKDGALDVIAFEVPQARILAHPAPSASPALPSLKDPLSAPPVPPKTDSLQ
ncbi:MAG TPA: type III-B CRISPR module RAMP protein Cmr6 [Verrucomicrobiota bacterium]|nr:type III-B CRISPR module RAMP protein Cmr6 [Verrucomicrobiota bacterium]HNT14585.1 type III-B CRISPR module RAMP protein Cmr6 [Verrucomicrobiota bacterium]